MSLKQAMLFIAALIPTPIILVSEATAASFSAITAVGSETMMEGKTVMPPSSKFIMQGKSIIVPVMHGRHPTYKE